MQTVQKASMYDQEMQGQIQDFWKGFHMYKYRGFALLILSHFSQISHENEIIWSHKWAA